MSAKDAGIQKKIHGSGTTTLIISNEEINDIMKIVQALEDSNSLLKGVTKTIKNEANSLSNFEIKEFCENKLRFNGVYSRDIYLKQ